MTSKFVVHCRKWPYDVYIGRPSPSIHWKIPGSDGRWGNPFEMNKDGIINDGTREQVITKHREWLLSDIEYRVKTWQKFTKKELMNRIRDELKGKVLGCWCAPLQCHGDTLAELANQQQIKSSIKQNGL